MLTCTSWIAIRKNRPRPRVMEYQMSTPNKDYWWWSDGLYMVMPVMTKMYHATGNKQYLVKLYEYFDYSNSIMWDNDAHLYYRDARYVYPKHQSVNGKKDFWSRGDGWVFAGLAKVLQDLPMDDPHRTDFVVKYQQMAEALKQAQSEDGYWTRSLLDPQHAPDRKPAARRSLCTATCGASITACWTARNTCRWCARAGAI
jgi:rhamnogalacturonyl hydrolase YesR